MAPDSGFTGTPALTGNYKWAVVGSSASISYPERTERDETGAFSSADVDFVSAFSTGPSGW